ncbi:PREDICTED: leucine-rich PPR motif-containing protein, mitochondrial-like [Polistes canadensis]|uniref:leucine-rich PPR motif-containing protein, mitochondrial-like n=1 Tax=Polistes canadensis TaxID=91411 RepID=UPI000718EF2E|nr:PREDICTED: leucine-rich PPR motif-containing protein, mitochondrial-like [Polistes canadensis]
MFISKRYLLFLKSYKKTFMNCYPKFYRLDKYYSKQSDFIYFYKCRKKQQFNFYSTVTTNFTPILSQTLQNEVVDLYINLRNGKVCLDDFKQIIQMYDETDNTLSNDIGLILLKCCGNLLPNVDLPTRQKLTSQVWNLLHKKGCQITLEHYNCLLTVYAQNLETINPHEFLDKITIKPDQSIYCSLLNLLSKTENVELLVATNIISKMKENLDTWDEEIFNMIVKVYAMQGNIEEANKVIKEMESNKIMPSPDTYIYLAYGFAKMGNISNVMETFEKYHPNTMNIMEVIKILSRHGHGEHIESILKFLSKSLKLTDLNLITNTITELIYAGDRINTIKILNNLPSCPEVINTYVEYVKCFVNEDIQSNKPDKDILQMIHEIINYNSSPYIINEATKITLYNGRKLLALTLFEDMKKYNIPIRSHYYWPLLLQVQKNADKNKLYSLFSHMISLNVEIDKDTLIEYVLPFIDVTDPIKTITTLSQKEINFMTLVRSISAFLLDNNRLNDLLSLLSKLRVNLDFCDSHLQKSLVQGYIKATSASDYASLMLQIPHIKKPPYLYILNALLDDAFESKTLKQLINFLQILKKHKVKLSESELDVMVKRIFNIKVDAVELETVFNLLSVEEIDLNYKSNTYKRNESSLILSVKPHPTKMDIEQLHNHMIELKFKNMNIRGVLKKLLDQYCKQNDLKAAEKIKEEIILNNFDWTPGMRAGLFHLYVRNNLLDKAEAELNEIQTKYSEFKLDTSKILLYAVSLVKNNRVEDAFNLINNVKNINISSNTISGCLNLLMALIESEDPDDAEKMIITLSENNYCKLDNILFSPLIERHLMINDIESAADTFIYCANKYKKTPLKQKLLDILIQNSADLSLSYTGDKLKQILKCITDIHGEPVSIVKLIIALARSDKVPEIQIIFQKKDVQMKLLLYELRKKTHDNILDILLTIFKAIKNEDNTKVKHMCDFILSTYDQKNDYKGGAAFLNEMKAASIPISKNKLERKFGNLVAQ